MNTEGGACWRIAHRSTPFVQTWPALMMLAAALYFMFSGAGALSLDRLTRLDPQRSTSGS